MELFPISDIWKTTVRMKNLTIHEFCEVCYEKINHHEKFISLEKKNHQEKNSHHEFCEIR